MPSASSSESELAPARLRGILAELWKNAGFAGMKWETEGWSRAGNDGWLARVGYDSPDGVHRETVVGLREGEDGWMIAPDLLERVAAVRGPQIPAEVPLPDEVAALVEAYWQARKAGKLGEAWLLMSPRFRESQPPEEYAQRSAAVVAETGLPVAWKVLHCKQLSPMLLGLGYGVTTTKGEFQTRMIAVKDGERGVLEDVQWRKAEGTATPAVAPAARPFSTDLTPGGLKTDLRTPLGK